ncbi:hypothetical protein NQZ79_g3749 [Umbelopsis isabellina]|nr:hypothetical protein NQZ79_g3749 [Umbelopsis isabellina]
MTTLQQQPAHIHMNQKFQHRPQTLEHKYKRDREFAQQQAATFLAKQQMRKQTDAVTKFATTSLNGDKSTCDKYGLKKRIIPDTPRNHVTAPRESGLSPVRHCKLPSKVPLASKDCVQQNTLMNTHIQCDKAESPCRKTCNGRKVSFQDRVVIIPCYDDQSSLDETDSDDEPHEPQQQMNNVFATPFVTSGSTLNCSLESHHVVHNFSSQYAESDLHQYGHITKQLKKFGKWFS